LLSSGFCVSRIPAPVLTCSVFAETAGFAVITPAPRPASRPIGRIGGDCPSSGILLKTSRAFPGSARLYVVLPRSKSVFATVTTPVGGIICSGGVVRLAIRSSGVIIGPPGPVGTGVGLGAGASLPPRFHRGLRGYLE